MPTLNPEKRDEELALKQIGRAIRGIRKAKGMSQELLSMDSGLSRAYANKLENGSVNVSIKTLCKICRVLDVSLSEIFGHGKYR